MTRTLSEMLLVLAAGLLLGLTVNAFSSQGLDLGRDYFPSGVAGSSATGSSEQDQDAAPPAAADPIQESPVTEGEAESPAPEDAQDTSPESAPLSADVQQRLAEKGLRGINHSEAHALWQDPMYEYEAYAFIDARDDDHYAAGHIPGAYQFDHFRAERFQEQMLMLLPTSMKVVVYCNGGDCEDSESAALFLLALGANPDTLSVYTGGIAEWEEQGLPVETGARNSGLLKGEAP